MKRIMLLTLALIAMLFVAYPVIVQAAGTVTWTVDRVGMQKNKVVDITWTADAAAATVPNKNIFDKASSTTTGNNDSFHGWIVKLICNPGSPAPTDNYDITLNDSDSIDMIGGAGANRDSNDSEQFLPLISGTRSAIRIDDKMVFTLSGNAVNSATGVCRVFMVTDDY